MMLPLDATFPRTLDALVEEFEAARGTSLEAWLFEDEAARRAAERRLAAAGVTARIRSAYKPLLHFFLEEVDRADLSSVLVRYPVHPAAKPGRFLLEAYPLAALLEDVDLRFEPGGAELDHQVTLIRGNGRKSEHLVFAPNRVHADNLGETALSPTGWVRSGGLDERRETEFEALFERVIGAVRDENWGTIEPYFERLDIKVQIPGIERPLALGGEVLSTREALHEDIYFSLLELFQRHSGRAVGDRRLQPGQIVPIVEPSDGAARLRIARLPFHVGAEPPADGAPLDEAGEPINPSRIHAELDALGGTPFSGTSRQGRIVRGLYRPGTGPAVLISGGQHANETSGVVGALRAARKLAERDAHFALIALENPDGYALNEELRRLNPLHMHHAARYTALGDDLEYREEGMLYERQARQDGLRLSGADLHINLHGYPAHEWTRPLSGYLPRTFELWTIPKGFFLIMRHHPGETERATRLVEAITVPLSRVPGLLDYNARQMATYQAHAGALPFPVINGFPCLISENTRQTPTFTFITEFPDETVAGDAFRFAHRVQMEAVLAATEAYLALA